jgi:hypothetical protein
LTCCFFFTSCQASTSSLISLPANKNECGTKHTRCQTNTPEDLACAASRGWLPSRSASPWANLQRKMWQKGGWEVCTGQHKENLLVVSQIDRANEKVASPRIHTICRVMQHTARVPDKASNAHTKLKAEFGELKALHVIHAFDI